MNHITNRVYVYSRTVSDLNKFNSNSSTYINIVQGTYTYTHGQACNRRDYSEPKSPQKPPLTLELDVPRDYILLLCTQVLHSE